MSTKHLDICDIDDVARHHNHLVEAVEDLEQHCPGAVLTTDGRRLLSLIEAVVALGDQLTPFEGGLRLISRVQENGGGAERFREVAAAYAVKHSPSSPPEALELQQLRLRVQSLEAAINQALPYAELALVPAVKLVAIEPAVGGAMLLTRVWDGDDADVRGWHDYVETPGGRRGRRRTYAFLDDEGTYYVTQEINDGGPLLFNGHTTVHTLDDVAFYLADALIDDNWQGPYRSINPALRSRMKARYPELFIDAPLETNHE